MSNLLRALTALLSLALPALARQGNEISLTRGLFIERIATSARELIRTDPIAHAMALGTFTDPAEGEAITLPSGDVRTWTALEAGENGAFDGGRARGGYAFFRIPSDTDRAMILEASGHAMVYVDGRPRAGDPYSNGSVRIPILLRKGGSSLLFAGAGRGPLAASLREPRGPAELSTADVTAPDLVRGRSAQPWLALPILNTTNADAIIAIEARVEGQFDWTPAAESSLGPLAMTKHPIQLPRSIAAASGDTVTVQLRALSRAHPALPADEASIALRIREPHQTRKETFLDPLDASVQYYALVPPTAPSANPALILSLHGAGVEAIGQADAYAPKPDAWIVCPTNRRPFGFDWEAWGRHDAITVLDLTQRSLGADPSRTYLTGHSMGGHGTWQLASLFPDRFAAAAPSAAWISFQTYTSARAGDPAPEPSPIRAMLRRAAATSDTLAFASNLARVGIFILHGDADDNVPVSEARRMADELTAFHRDWRLHEEPGAGHWWDGGEFGPFPGAACVDFPPIFELFAHRRLPPIGEVTRVDFTTVNPAVSGRCAWVEITAQHERLKPSRVNLTWDPLRRSITGTTDNVEALRFDPIIAGPQSLTIDGQTIEIAHGDVAGLRLSCAEGVWRTADEGLPIPPGTFTAAFDGFLFVYATKGTPEENAWSRERAEFDAEQWWYRGNGRATIISDVAYLSKRTPVRAVLYGNAQTNAAWTALPPDGGVEAVRSGIRIGDRSFERPGLGLLAIRRLGNGPVIGLIGGTDVAGCRTTDRLPVFLSGVGIPEVVVLDASFWTDGEAGILGAGLLGNDWSIEGGEFAWRDPPSP